MPTVAYHPHVDLRTESQEQFVEQVLHTLSVASVLSGRRIALPFVPCDSAWLKHTPPPPEHASSSSSVPAFGTCRTGLCDDWRVYRYGTLRAGDDTRLISTDQEGRRERDVLWPAFHAPALIPVWLGLGLGLRLGFGLG